jgi:hypothetical protein
MAWSMVICALEHNQEETKSRNIAIDCHIPNPPIWIAFD